MPRVYGDVRMLAGILLTVVLSRTALADAEEPRVRPLPTRAIGIALAIHGGEIDGIPQVSLGPNAELALGSGRTQHFIEGGPQWVTFGGTEESEDGLMLRGALGARWIARSFEIEGTSGAIELVLEGLVGAQRIWLEESNNLTRFELAVGVGMQARRYWPRQFAMRMMIRAMFTPGGEHVGTATRATKGPTSVTDGGIMLSIGFAR